MVFEPHLSRLAPRHQPEHPLPAPTMPRRTISVYAALVEALGLFYAKPLQAIALGGVWALAGAITCLPAAIVDTASYQSNSTGMTVVSIGGLDVPVEMVMIGAAAVGLAFLGAPLLVGVYAAAIRSARQGAPTCKGLLTGFAQYRASFAIGALAGVISAVLGLLPVLGAIAGFLLGTFMWVAMSALADRRAGLYDALNSALVLTGGRFFTLVLLNLAAGVVMLVGGLVACVGLLMSMFDFPLPEAIASGGLVACVGLLMSIPVMVLMLGIGYRDVAEAAGLTEAQPEDAA